MRCGSHFLGCVRDGRSSPPTPGIGKGGSPGSAASAAASAPVPLGFCCWSRRSPRFGRAQRATCFEGTITPGCMRPAFETSAAT
eukprot:14142540-Alexandrium_andersonii.AAC.1